VWSKLFTENPLSRETGERFKDEVLGYGGEEGSVAHAQLAVDAPENSSLVTPQ